MKACSWQPDIERFFLGQLAEAEAEDFLLHLDACAGCEAAVEAWWSKRAEVFGLAAADQVPLPDTAKAQRRLLRALQPQPGGGQLIALVTQGLVKSVLALLEPVFGLLSGSEPSAAD